MKHMKKWLALLLVAALSICMLAACSGDGDTADETHRSNRCCTDNGGRG